MLCFDKLKVAECFNVASSLLKKLPSCTDRFGTQHVSEYYQNKGITNNMFGLSSVSKDQVTVIINKMGSSKATGLDNLPERFVKDSASFIVKPLTHVINISITSGCVPADLKLARVVPLYKKKNKIDCGNYHPVSILSIVSKVFERVVYNQINA